MLHLGHGSDNNSQSGAFTSENFELCPSQTLISNILGHLELGFDLDTGLKKMGLTILEYDLLGT